MCNSPVEEQSLNFLHSLKHSKRRFVCRTSDCSRVPYTSLVSNLSLFFVAFYTGMFAYAFLCTFSELTNEHGTLLASTPSSTQSSAYSVDDNPRRKSPVSTPCDAEDTFRIASQRQTEPKGSPVDHERVEHLPKTPMFKHPDLLFDKDPEELTPTELHQLQTCQRFVKKRLQQDEYNDGMVALGRHGTLLWCRYCSTDLDAQDISRLKEHFCPKHDSRKKIFLSGVTADTETRALLQHPDSPIYVAPHLLDTYVVLLVFLRWVLACGIVQAQYDGLRALLAEVFNFKLCDLDQLRGLIPFVRFQEKMKAYNDISIGGDIAPMSIIFDGSTLHHETELFIARYITPDFRIRETLIDLRSLNKSQNMDTMQRLISDALNSIPNFNWSRLVAYVCDNVQTNISAVTNLMATMGRAVLAGCMSHMCDHVGDRLFAPELSYFKTLLIGITNSPTLMVVWQAGAKSVPPVPNNTRWWTEAPFYDYWLDRWSTLEAFIVANIATQSEHYAGLRIVFGNKSAWRFLRFQMCVVAEAARFFVLATYITEGSGLVIVHVAKYMDDIIAKISSFRLPETEDVIERLVDEEYADMLANKQLPRLPQQAESTSTTLPTSTSTMRANDSSQTIDQQLQRGLSVKDRLSNAEQSSATTPPSAFTSPPTHVLPSETIHQSTRKAEAVTVPTSAKASSAVNKKKGASTSKGQSNKGGKGSRYKADQIAQKAEQQSIGAHSADQSTTNAGTDLDEATAVKDEIRRKYYQLVDQVVLPALQYFVKTFCQDPDRARLLQHYRHAAILNPQVAAKCPNADALKEAVKKLECFPILTAPPEHRHLLTRMQAECGTYLQYCQAYPITWASHEDRTMQRAAEDEAILEWWRRWGKDIPNLAFAARAIFSIAPSSGAVERKFSLFKRLFQDKPRALTDMQEAALLLHNKFDDRK